MHRDCQSVYSLVYVGSAGKKGGNLRSRLLKNLESRGWQTAFRRKVFEHAMGVSERPRSDASYKALLRQSCSSITALVTQEFGFKCLATRDFSDFEIWLVRKYGQRLWNRQLYARKAVSADFSMLEAQLIEMPLIRFCDLPQQLLSVPEDVGVYFIFRNGKRA